MCRSVFVYVHECKVMSQQTEGSVCALTGPNIDSTYSLSTFVTAKVKFLTHLNNHYQNYFLFTKLLPHSVITRFSFCGAFQRFICVQETKQTIMMVNVYRLM